MRRLGAGLATVALLLAGCSTSSPEADLQSRSNDVVASANAGDSAALRGAASRMLAEIKKQNDAGDLTTSKKNALQVLLARIIANADDLDATESPSPSPSAESPSPSPSPSPEPSPSESPSPEPSPEPSPVESPSPDVVPSVVSPKPIAVQPSPSEF